MVIGANDKLDWLSMQKDKSGQLAIRAKATTDHHGKMNQLVIRGKGANWLSVQKDKRGQLAIRAKGPPIFQYKTMPIMVCHG